MKNSVDKKRLTVLNYSLKLENKGTKRTARMFLLFVRNLSPQAAPVRLPNTAWGRVVGVITARDLQRLVPLKQFRQNDVYALTWLTSGLSPHARHDDRQLACGMR